MNHTEPDERIMELLVLARRNGRVYCSNFYHRDLFEEMRPSGNFILSGGGERSERVMLIALPEFVDRAKCNVFDYIKCVEITPSDGKPHTHRDYLGSVMALQIERAKLGDFIVTPKACYVFGQKTVLEYVAAELKNVAGTSCSVRFCAPENLPVQEKVSIVKTETVSSLRLDNVIGTIFHLSRSQSAEMIENGLVRITGKICLKPEKSVRDGDVLSVRGKGRSTFLSHADGARKGRIRITFESE